MYIEVSDYSKPLFSRKLTEKSDDPSIKLKAASQYYIKDIAGMNLVADGGILFLDGFKDLLF